MFKADIDHAVAAIVKATLPRFSPKDKGLIVSLDVRMNVYGPRDGEIGTSNLVHFLFIRPNNYTKVMGAVSKKAWFISDLKPSDWKMYSDHDSCWSSDGFRLLNKIYREQQNSLINAGFKRSDISEFCWVHDVSFVKVELEQYDDEGRFGRFGKSQRPKSIVRMENWAFR